MPTVEIPRDFFVQERRVYDNWKIAFWRELFQNSVDAGARQIDVKVDWLSEDSADGCRVVFEDDGCGMDREVLEQVYFRAGASTKRNDPEKTGGFGRARLLTCFSQKAYEIRTNGCRAWGSGGEYQIDDAPFFKGCRLAIEIDDAARPEMIFHLEDYLRESQLAPTVVLNGERWTDWAYRGKATRVLDDPYGQPFATVHKSAGEKARHKGRLIVRVAGASMFNVWSSASEQVIVELRQDRARDVLTAGRDRLRHDYQRTVSAFLEVLAIDRETAMRDRSGRRTLRYRGRDGVFEEGGEAQAAESRQAVGPDLIQETFAAAAAYAPLSPAAPGRVLGEGDRENGSTGGQLLDGHDVFLREESPSGPERRAMKLYQPDRWSAERGLMARKLLAAWAVACQAAVRETIELRRLRRQKFGVGWLFGGDDLAMNEMTEGLPVLLLKPVDSSGKALFKLSDPRSRKRIMAIAKHEAAHLVEDTHDICFANLLTEIDARFDEKAVDRAMLAAIRSVGSAPRPGPDRADEKRPPEKPAAHAGALERATPAGPASKPATTPAEETAPPAERAEPVRAGRWLDLGCETMRISLLLRSGGSRVVLEGAEDRPEIAEALGFERSEELTREVFGDEAGEVAALWVRSDLRFDRAALKRHFPDARAVSLPFREMRFDPEKARPLDERGFSQNLPSAGPR